MKMFELRSRFNRNCVCLINRLSSFGLPTGSVVVAIQDIPLPGGERRPTRKNMGGWGGGCRQGAFAWQYHSIIALNYVGPKVNNTED